MVPEKFFGANEIFFGVWVGLLEWSNTGVDPGENLKCWISILLERKL